MPKKAFAFLWWKKKLNEIKYGGEREIEQRRKERPWVERDRGTAKQEGDNIDFQEKAIKANRQAQKWNKFGKHGHGHLLI